MIIRAREEYGSKHLEYTRFCCFGGLLPKPSPKQRKDYKLVQLVFESDLLGLLRAIEMSVTDSMRIVIRCHDNTYIIDHASGIGDSSSTRKADVGVCKISRIGVDHITVSCVDEIADKSNIITGISVYLMGRKYMDWDINNDADLELLVIDRIANKMISGIAVALGSNYYYQFYWRDKSESSYHVSDVIRNVADHVPGDLVLYVEGTDMVREVRSYYESVALPYINVRESVLGNPDCWLYMLPVNSDMIDRMEYLSEKYALPEILSHLRVYNGNSLLMEWPDFSDDCDIRVYPVNVGLEEVIRLSNKYNMSCECYIP